MAKHFDDFSRYVIYMDSVFGPIRVGKSGLEPMPFLGLVVPSSGTKEPATDIDFDALFETLLRDNKHTSAKLIRFMKNKTIASFQDVMDGAFGKNLAESTLRSYVNRANNDLHELKSRLWFDTKQSHVIRHIDPA
jgi:hypothetical protein